MTNYWLILYRTQLNWAENSQRLLMKGVLNLSHLITIAVSLMDMNSTEYQMSFWIFMNKLYSSNGDIFPECCK